jgi:hypothetical protein
MRDLEFRGEPKLNRLFNDVSFKHAHSFHNLHVNKLKNLGFIQTDLNKNLLMH